MNKGIPIICSCGRELSLKCISYNTDIHSGFILNQGDKDDIAKKLNFPHEAMYDLCPCGEEYLFNIK